MIHHATARAGGNTVEAKMRKPNYRFERAERDRLKLAKKEEKLKRQQERVAQQKGEEPDEGASPPSSDNA